MSDEPTTGRWTPKYIREKICSGYKGDIFKAIAGAHNAALAAAALEIKSLKAVEANYNETHQILTNTGVKHEGMDVAFRVNAALAAEREKHQ